MQKAIVTLNPQINCSQVFILVIDILLIKVMYLAKEKLFYGHIRFIGIFANSLLTTPTLLRQGR